jgi:hypothetical protein
VLGLTTAGITAVGALLAGIGSFLGGLAAITYAYKKAREDKGEGS